MDGKQLKLEDRYYIVPQNSEGVGVWFDFSKGMYYIGIMGPHGGIVRHQSKSYSYIMERWERHYAWVK